MKDPYNLEKDFGKTARPKRTPVLPIRYTTKNSVSAQEIRHTICDKKLKEGEKFETDLNRIGKIIDEVERDCELQ